MIFKKRIILLKKKKINQMAPNAIERFRKRKKRQKAKKQNQTPTPSETIGNQQCIYTLS